MSTFAHNQNSVPLSNNLSDSGEGFPPLSNSQQDITINASALSAIASTQAPAPNPQNVPAALSVLASAQAPAPQVSQLVSPIGSVASVQAPSLTIDATFTAAALSTIASVQAPTVSVGASATFNASVLSAVATVEAPVPQIDIAASNLSVTSSPQSPTPAVSISVLEQGVTAGTQGSSVSTGGNVTVIATTLSASSSVETPTFTVVGDIVEGFSSADSAYFEAIRQRQEPPTKKKGPLKTFWRPPPVRKKEEPKKSPKTVKQIVERIEWQTEKAESLFESLANKTDATIEQAISELSTIMGLLDTPAEILNSEIVLEDLQTAEVEEAQRELDRLQALKTAYQHYLEALKAKQEHEAKLQALRARQRDLDTERLRDEEVLLLMMLHDD